MKDINFFITNTLANIKMSVYFSWHLEYGFNNKIGNVANKAILIQTHCLAIFVQNPWGPDKAQVKSCT